jgi:Flp pilus assembly secretin CpaC
LKGYFCRLKKGFLAGLVVAGLAVLPAQAQQAPQAQPRDPVAVESLPIWEPGSPAQVFEIPMNKARAIKLQSPVRDVIVSNEAIADVIVPDTAERSNQVFITARAVGTSNVFLLGADGEVLLQAEIRVHSRRQ